MKNTLLITFVLLVIAIGYKEFGNDNSIKTNIIIEEEIPTPTELIANPYAIKYIDDTSKLTLSSNLASKKPAYELFENCEFLVNGGFYSKEDKHIGLLISDYNEISPYQRNDTFNGFLYFDKNEFPVISDIYPDSARVALQSGPVIKLDSIYRNLKLSTDKNARRIIAATTKDGDLVFIVVYQNDSKLFGPKLSELPTILMDIESEEGIVFDSAINLDGGSASSFYDKQIIFAESSTIGSYFCLTK